jgi:hypothetical protein
VLLLWLVAVLSPDASAKAFIEIPILLPRHSCFAVSSVPGDDDEVACCLLLAAFEVLYWPWLAKLVHAASCFKQKFGLRIHSHKRLHYCVCRRLLHYTYILYENTTSSRLLRASVLCIDTLRFHCCVTLHKIISHKAART